MEEEGPKKKKPPNHQLWCAKWKLSRNVYTLRTRFLHVLAPDLRARPVPINKISASELSQKSIKSALLVGLDMKTLTVKIAKLGLLAGRS